MANLTQGVPTNERAKKVDKIITLNLIKRDHIIYSNFENLCEENVNISYLFCKECEHRYSAIHGGTASSSSKNNITGDMEENKVNESLENIDKKLYEYWNYLYVSKIQNRVIPNYESYIEADAYFLKQALGEERFYEIPFYGMKSDSEKDSEFENVKVDMYPVKIRNFVLEYLNDTDMKMIKDYLLKQGNTGINTIIKRKYSPYPSASRMDYIKHKNKILVELDLSKPLKEIKSFIESLHHDFRETDKIKTIYNLLDIEMKSFDAELHKYNIYIKNNRASKNNVQLLTDILFVFDCVHSGFDLGLIVELLNTYYDPKKVEESVVKNYYDFANNFITEKNYSSFISGFLTPME